MMSRQTFRQIKIFFNGSEIVLNGLVDTGNTLCEPISGSPVIVAEFGEIKDCLPEKVTAVIMNNEEHDLPKLLESFSGSCFSERVRFIPFSGIGRENGIIIGFRPDKTEIGADEKNAVIGIYNHKLSKHGDYCALINPVLAD